MMADFDRVVRVRVLRWMQDPDGKMVAPGTIQILSINWAMMLARQGIVEFVRDGVERAVVGDYEKRDGE